LSPANKYLLDTDVLALIRHRTDSETLYNGVIALADVGVAKTVRQVFDELKKHAPAFKILSPHKAKFVISLADQYCPEVSEHIETLGNGASYLWPQTGSKNPDPADPWLIAVAVHHSYTVVTNESSLKTKSIPAASKLFGARCRCISGPHFLHEVGLVTQLKPEHISAALFFTKDS